MEYGTIRCMHFSPAGTTRTVGEKIAGALGANYVSHDLLKKPLHSPVEFAADELLVIGAPVFAGRIPGVVAGMLANIRGRKTPAVMYVTYGNRAYDDALMELRDIVEKNGFVVVGAGAFVAQHSVFPLVAPGRPDTGDAECIESFAMACGKKLKEQAIDEMERLVIPGNFPYIEPKDIPLKPSGDASCTNCGQCVAICPVAAIERDTPRKTDKAKCIACVACIAVCPVQARKFSGALYRIFGAIFRMMVSKRKEPTVYI